jgi:hypothetical protein
MQIEPACVWQYTTTNLYKQYKSIGGIGKGQDLKYKNIDKI